MSHSKDDKKGFIHREGSDDHGTVIYDGREGGFSVGKRFQRVARLLQPSMLDFFALKHVVIFGVGGVGSFVVESLARTGIGQITMVDFDQVCETNINRQLPALNSTIGNYKVDCLVERCSQINPCGCFIGRRLLYHAATPDELITSADFVVDAIDNVTAKTLLIASCLEKNIPLATSMGAGGKMDPTRVRVSDLAKTHTDALARVVRRVLRQDYHLDTKKPLGVPAVFSDEPGQTPFRQPGDTEETLPQGTLSCVTGTFGLVLASLVIQHFVQSQRAQSVE